MSHTEANANSHWRLRRSPPATAIVGATGAVGAELLAIIEERDFPVRELRLLASPRSAGKTLTFRGHDIGVEVLGEQSFDGIDLALFSAGSGIAREYAPAAARAGAIVIDNSSAFRMNPAVPLVVPEINAAALAGHDGIVANPNCAAIIAITPLWPIHRENRIRRLILSTYQAASGAGAAAMAELAAATRAHLCGDVHMPRVLPHALRRPTCSATTPRSIPLPAIMTRRSKSSAKREKSSAIERCGSARDVHPRARAARACGGGDESNASTRSTRTQPARCSPARPVAGWSTTASGTASRCRSRQPDKTTSWSGASAVTSATRRGIRSACSSPATSCARAPRSTRCRSPNCCCRERTRRSRDIHHGGTERRRLNWTGRWRPCRSVRGLSQGRNGWRAGGVESRRARPEPDDAGQRNEPKVVFLRYAKHNMQHGATVSAT